jgi:hypothetical protein
MQILGSVEGLRIPAYQKSPEGFLLRGRRPATLVPLDVEMDRDAALPPNALQEVTLVFPGYAEEAGRVQVALDAATGEKGWLALGPSVTLTRLDLDSPSDLDRWAGASDLLSLLREPFLRAYAAPSPRSPWTVLDPLWSPSGSDSPWSLSIRKMRDGFALVEARPCVAGEESGVSLGWVRLWDAEGHLLVWPTPGASGCG